MSETRDKDREHYQKLYEDAEWQAYMLPYYEELMEQQKRRARRDKLEIAVSIAGTVIFCLLLIGYCVARILV